jgi:citrate lyase beta subunit
MAQEPQSKHPSARRSLLFMPGDSLRKIEKATTLAVDSVIMDLEDGVARSRKDAARATVVQALTTLDFGARERLVRINPVDSPFSRSDLDATIAARPDGYVIPKVESAEDLQSVGRYLDEAERANGWPRDGLRLLAIIETAHGVMNLAAIAGATSRLDALMFGAEDLAGDMGAMRTRAGWEVFYARSAVVIAAAAHRLQAIDTVFIDLSDLDGLAEECRFARQLGYIGKMAIHPRQVPVINAAFSPTDEEIAQARRLIAAHDEQQADGAGVFELDGKMIDMPMVRAAMRVLDRARAAGI